MSIIQISKIQVRSGNLVDLPQLSEAEFGWASDSKKLFIGKTTPNENVELLTSYSTISFSQIDGSGGNNLNISNAQSGQILSYNGTDWVNKGGNAAGLITLGDLSNVKINGGTTGYVLATDGTGNLSWTPKSAVVATIVDVTQADPAVVTTEQDNFFTEGAEVTITEVLGMTQLNGNSYYVDVLTSNTFALYSDALLTASVNSIPYTTYISDGRVIAPIGSGGGTLAAGANTAIQFNNTNLLDGSPNFTYDFANIVLTVNGNITSNNSSVSGNVSASRLISNVATGTSPLVVSSTTQVANLNSATSGAVINNAQPNITSVGTLTSLAVTGNVTSGNATLGNLTTSNYFTGVLTTNAQPNVTSVGTLTSLAVTGNITSGNATLGNLTTSNYFVGNGSLLTGLVAGNISGTVATSNYAAYAGNVTLSGQANITSVGTLTSLAVTGNISGANLTGTHYGAATGLTSIPGANVTGTVANATYATSAGSATTAGTITTNAQPNITSVGTLSSLAVTGNISGANLTGTHYGAATGLTSIPGANVTGTVANATYATSAGSATTAGTVTTAAQPNITSVGTLSALTVTGNTTLSGANVSLGSVSNLHITGGTSGYVLSTDGAGNLSWAVGSNAIAGSYVFTQASATTTWVITHNLGVQYVNIEIIDNTGNSWTGRYNYPTIKFNNTSVLTVTFDSAQAGFAAITSGAIAGLTIGGSSSQIQFNNAGSLGGSAALTFNNSSNTVSVGGTLAVTGNANAANFNGTFYGAATGLTSIPGANITGAVTYATTANSVAVANVSGIGNIATINKDGNASNILYGNGVFASAPAASGYGNSNVATFLASYGSNTITTTGNVSVGNITGTHYGAATGLTSIPGANVSGTVPTATTAGTVTTAAQPNITSVGTLAGLVVAGNITPSANITYNLGNNTNRFNDLYLSNSTIYIGAQTISANATSVTVSGSLVANITGNVTTAGTVTTAAQPNITSVGTLTSISVSGTSNLGAVGNVTITGGTNGYVLSTNGSGGLSWVVQSGGGGGTPGGSNTQVQFNDSGSFGGNASFTFNKTTGTLVSTIFSGAGNALSNIQGANVSGTVPTATSAGSATTAGTVTTAAQPNITSVGTLSSLAVTGNISGANLTGTHYGAATGLTSIPGANVTGTVANATYATSAGSATTATTAGSATTATSAGSATTAGTVTTAAQPNITSVGTLSSLAVTGNISGANITGTHYGAATGLTSIPGANVTGTVANATYATSAGSATTASSAGSATTAGTVTTAAQPNITSVGTLSSLAVTGNITSGNLSYTGTLTGGTGIVNLGSGQFYKDASGSVGIGLTPAASRGLLQVNGGILGTDTPLSVKQFGAVGNGTTDDTAAINAALAESASTGRSVYVPAGRYLITSNLTASNNLHLYGDTSTSSVFIISGAATSFVYTGSGTGGGGDPLPSTAGIFNTTQLLIERMGFDVITYTASNTRNVISATWVNAANFGNTAKTFTMRDCDIYAAPPPGGSPPSTVSGNWNAAVYLAGAWNSSILNSRIMGARWTPRNCNYCVYLDGGTGLATKSMTEIYFDQVHFSYAIAGIYASGYIEGVNVVSSVILECENNIIATTSSGVPNLGRPWLTILNNHFTAYNSGIVTSGWLQMEFCNNLFYALDATPYVCITLNNVDYGGLALYTIISNNIIVAAPSATSYGIVVNHTAGGGESVNIMSNYFTSLTTGIQLNTGTIQIRVMDTNRYVACTNTVVNNGSTPSGDIRFW